MKRPLPNPRQLWRPKREEVAQQCASCPFRHGNDAEFGIIVSKLLGHPAGQEDIQMTRLKIWHDLRHTGDFMCHCTVYTADMTLRPEADFRQCQGATQAFRNTTFRK